MALVNGMTSGQRRRAERNAAAAAIVPPPPPSPAPTATPISPPGTVPTPGDGAAPVPISSPPGIGGVEGFGPPAVLPDDMWGLLPIIPTQPAPSPLSKALSPIRTSEERPGDIGPSIATPPPPPPPPWLNFSTQISAPSLSGSSITPRTVNAPPAPTFSVSPAAQSLIDQFVQNTQTQGSRELSRQLLEDILPSLKAAAAASGQVSPDGVVSGAFLENLTRQQGQTGRELANIVLGAQTSGLEKSLQQGQFEMEQGGKAADRTLQADIENAKNDLHAAQISSNERLKQAEISLQAQVESGKLSLGQANLAFETAKAESEDAINQQKLRLGMLNLLSGRELDIAKLGMTATNDAQDRQLREIEMLTRLGGKDFEELLNAIQAIKLGGQSTQTSGGNLLGDILGLGQAGVGIAAGAKYLGI